MRITLEDIFSLSSAVIYYPDRYKSISSVSIDTRTLKKNSLYVAIKGEKFDGHDFVKDAISNGAKAIVVSNRKLKNFEDVEVPIISVKNTLVAYAEIANIWRNKFSTKVISITGSNGKTTTKEIVAQLLSEKYKVHKTFANNNNQIGVPLTILSTPKNTDFVVLEHGTNHFGEIDFTAKIAEPDYAIITNIGTSHTKYLESKSKILEEKEDLFKSVKHDGFVFINNDDLLLKPLAKKYKNAITFGFKGKCDVKAKKNGLSKKTFNKISIDGFGKSIEVSLPLLGDSSLKNYLSAVSIALKCKVSKSGIVKQTKHLEPPKGRLQVKDYKSFTIIDDTYNANPESVEAAINVLKDYKQRSKKIIILGDMFELGENSASEHTEIGKLINKSKIDGALLIGNASRNIYSNISKIKLNQFFTNREKLVKVLSSIDITDTVVLVKGSRGMKMEEFVKVLEMREN